jgi:hypothetical protein
VLPHYSFPNLLLYTASPCWQVANFAVSNLEVEVHVDELKDGDNNHDKVEQTPRVRDEGPEYTVHYTSSALAEEVGAESLEMGSLCPPLLQLRHVSVTVPHLRSLMYDPFGS